MTLASYSSKTTNASFPIHISFSQDVADFTREDLAVTGGVVKEFRGSGTSYWVLVAPVSEGTLSVSVPENAAHSASGATHGAVTLEKTISASVDKVAPSGHTVPDWSYAGVEGGIPNVSGPVFPVPPGASTTLIQAKIDEAGNAGGGVVLFPEGTFSLTEPLAITHDNVVLRGSGRDATTLRFTYQVNPGEFRWFRLTEGQHVYQETPLELHAYAVGLAKVEVTVTGPSASGVPLRWFTGEADNHIFSSMKLGVNLGMAEPNLVEGQTYLLQATATWNGGATATVSRSIIYHKSYRNPERKRRYALGSGAINFGGDDLTGRGGYRWSLHQSARRGDTTVFVAHDATSPYAFLPGDIVRIQGWSSDEWDALVQNTGQPNMPVMQHLVVKSVSDAAGAELAQPAPEGKQVWKLELRRPLRHPYLPLKDAESQDAQVAMDARVDASYFPIRNGGVESLTLVQPENTSHSHYDDELFADGITMHTAQNMWVRDVRVRSVGRNPVSLEGLNLEVRNSVFDGSWWTGVGQGTAYASYGGSTDSLMDGVAGFGLRHAPNAQQSTNGSVFRRCYFEADAQYHMSWAHENLYEDCIVDARPLRNALRSDGMGTGAYGYGVYAQHGQNNVHGPGAGPRNVVYGSDFRANEGGIFLGGATEGFLALYNRFRVTHPAPGILLNDFNENHLFFGNVFSLNTDAHVLVSFLFPDAAGTLGNHRNRRNGSISVVDNRIYSKVPQPLLSDGVGVSQSTGNEWLPWQLSPPRPTPEVSSLFSWQRNTVQTRVLEPAHQGWYEVGQPMTLLADLKGSEGSGAPPPGSVLKWFVDGKEVASGQQASWTPPSAGRKLLHTEVHLPDGRVEQGPLLFFQADDPAYHVPDAQSLVLHWVADSAFLELDGSGRVSVWNDRIGGRQAVPNGNLDANVPKDSSGAPIFQKPLFVTSGSNGSGAIRFDGSSDGLGFKDPANFGLELLGNHHRTYVVAFRYTEDQPSGSGHILGLGTANRIGVGNGARQCVNIRNNTVTWESEGTALSKNATHVLAVSGTHVSTDVFVDGARLSTSPVSSPLMMYDVKWGDFNIGHGAFSGRDFRGDVFEVLVFNEALSELQIQRISERIRARR